MLTDRDLVVGPFAQAAEDLESLTIGDVMTTPPVTACETDSLDAALTTMERHGVRRLPVVSGTGSLVGVLTVDDVLTHATAELGKLVDLMAHEDEQEQTRRP